MLKGQGKRWGKLYYYCLAILVLTRGGWFLVGCPGDPAGVRLDIAAHGCLVDRWDFVPVKWRVEAATIDVTSAAGAVDEERTGAGCFLVLGV